MNTGSGEWTSFVAVLALMPDVVERLAADHVPDPSSRCLACTVGGRGTPGTRWPCGPAALATAARLVARRKDHEAALMAVSTIRHVERPVSRSARAREQGAVG